MSLKTTAAHSSRIRKSTPSIRRTSSSPFSSHPHRKPLARSTSKPDPFDEEPLDDQGLVHILTTDLTLRDVAQALQYLRTRMFSLMPAVRQGMNSERIAEVLRFRETLPPVVSIAHIQALLNSPTRVEREIAELVRGGAVRKIVVGGRGAMGECLVLVRDLEGMVGRSGLEEGVRERFLGLLGREKMALRFSRGAMSEEDVRALMQAGFLTVYSNTAMSDMHSRPTDGLRGTLTSLNAISQAASGSMAAVGGEGAVHNSGGSGGGARSTSGVGELALALPGTGSYLKLVAGAKAHLLSLLTKSRYKEAPENALKERWDGGVDDGARSEARRNRGEFAGVLPGRTRKWKVFWGVSFEWVMGECVGTGLVEVFETGSIGRGVRALK